jgi:hypothetical protein
MNAVVVPISAAPEAPSLDTLCERWTEAKRRENAANAERVAIEQQITAITGVREEGSATTTTEAGRKVVVTGKLSIKADLPQLVVLCDRLPEQMRPIKTETVVDERGIKYLRANEPEIYALIAPALEVKSAKPSVSIKEA